METVNLKSNDELIINATKFDYFIHIQNYFFYGTLNIDIFNTTTNNHSYIKGKPNDMLHFTHCILHINYSSKTAICKISFWVIDSQICRQDIIHYSSISSAYLELSNYSAQFDVCYFFESSVKPKISSDNPYHIDSIFYFMSDNGTLIKQYISDNISDFTISELSILRECHRLHYNISYRIDISTDLKFVDFTDNKNSQFVDFNDGSYYTCNITAPNFVVKRKVVWWIWLVIYLAPIVLIILGISLMLIRPRKETSFFSSSKPLISDASRTSMQSIF